MTPAIQCLRRSILYKTQNLLQFLQIKHQSQNPISHFTNFVTPQSSIQPQVRNFGSVVVTETRQLGFKNHLLRLLRNEIQYELTDSPLQQLPAEFRGFKVEERPGEQWISLGKKIGKSEEIAIEVTMFDKSVPIPKEGEIPGLPGEEVQLHITMIISIFKEKSNQVLELICSAFPDTLEIQKLFVREQSKFPTKQPYTGPKFRELDDQLQDSLYDFLHERGIDDNLCVFLHRYIQYKDKAEYIRWMESVKSMVE
ncbi:uncharacterized protein At2g39795, mitochondrial-like [Silene latifolia]|uniref:uncharacterized protein At2g39795, mitochondrial-like n=1 Tax=Silene latifolia TaxID=37657 RepID=UPI003D77B2F8